MRTADAFSQRAEERPNDPTVRQASVASRNGPGDPFYPSRWDEDARNLVIGIDSQDDLRPATQESIDNAVGRTVPGEPPDDLDRTEIRFRFPCDEGPSSIRVASLHALMGTTKQNCRDQNPKSRHDKGFGRCVGTSVEDRGIRNKREQEKEEKDHAT